MPKKKESRSVLPEKPPKRTGKRGVGPKLDPVVDFDSPVKKDPPEAKGSLLAEQPPKPTIVGDRMEVFYLKPLFGKTPKGDITVSLAITLPVKDEHDGLLPKIVHDGYKDILKKARKAINFSELPGQRAEFYISSDAKDESLVLPAAKMLSTSLMLIQRKGEGQSRHVVRLSFRLQVKLSHEVAHFAENNLQNSFWLKLSESQEELFDESDED
jgi:hypothetical protein